jgi:hypothetical protein
MTVQTIPPIEEMTPSQRVELMEALWKAMSKSRAEVEPPEWHRKVLDEREKALNDGETQFVDWEEAKADILRRTVDRRK